MNDELKDDLGSKMALCKQIEQDLYNGNEKIRQLEDQIAMLNRDAMQDKGQINDI